MSVLLKGGMLSSGDSFERRDILVTEEGAFVFENTSAADEQIDCEGKVIIPGFADVHVHFREPGFSYKETIASGTEAAAAGGYGLVCTMPNLDPAPSTLEKLKVQTDIIEKDALVRVIPYGTITMEQDGRSGISNMEEMAPFVCAFTDDGKGVQTGKLMEEAMKTARDLGKIIVAHAEDESLLGGTAIHDGRFAEAMGHRGISSASEWVQVERDIELAYKVGCPYHICHVSTKETVELVRQARKDGIDVTCETAPHYLTLSEEDLQDLGRFKMNPPIRSYEDREALLEGVADGTVDMIATDHAPHSAEEKDKGIIGSAFGVVGLETAFPVIHSRLVLPGIITLQRMIELMSIAPRKRFGLPGLWSGDKMAETFDPATEGEYPGWTDITVIDRDAAYTIDPDNFRSKGRATPFEGWEVTGRVYATISRGRPAYTYDQDR